MPKTIVTHDGTFHADDVCAVAALLLYLKGGAEVTRTRDTDAIAAADFVMDVGNVYDETQNRFDHHQPEGAGGRANGIPYAAFGLVWKKFGAEIAGSKAAAERVDATLVAPIDANDNGVALFSRTISGIYPYELSGVVKAFTPAWDEAPDLDRRFLEAVAVAKKILTREVVRTRAALRAEQLILSAYRDALDKRLIVLDENYPWKEMLARCPEPLYVVHPVSSQEPEVPAGSPPATRTSNGVHPQEREWYVESVRDNPALFVNRKELPAAWAGLRDSELAKVTGVPDAVFCHRNRFMAAARSKQGAIALAKLALAH